MDNGITLTPRLLWGWGSLLAIVIGSLGTWATFGPISVGGGDKDGAICIVLAVIAAVLVATNRWALAVAVLGAVTALVGIIDWSDISSTSVFGQSFSVGWGLVLVVAAGLSLCAWGIQDFRATRNAPDPEPRTDDHASG